MLKSALFYAKLYCTNSCFKISYFAFGGLVYRCGPKLQHMLIQRHDIGCQDTDESQDRCICKSWGMIYPRKLKQDYCHYMWEILTYIHLFLRFLFWEMFPQLLKGVGPLNISGYIFSQLLLNC